MSKNKYISALDIGTSQIRAVEARVEDDGSLNIVGISTETSFGLRRGQLTDIEECLSHVSKALEKLERMTGIPVEEVNVSISGSHISSQTSHGVIAVSKGDGEVSESDIVRCVDASQAIAVPQNREVLHVFPKNFILDGQTGIKDPLGMTGIRLEVESVIVQAGLPQVKNISKLILQSGVHLKELVLSPLAAAEAVLSKRQKDLGVLLLDLGAGTTGMSVYEEGELLYTAVLPLGQMHVTNDIAIGIRSSVDIAEIVKTRFGHTNPKKIPKDQEVDLPASEGGESEKVSRHYVAEIIEARLEEIFSLVQAELKKIGRDGKLPAGVVLTGGGSKLPDILDFTKKHLRLPSSIGKIVNVKTVIDAATESDFATAVGLILWGYDAKKNIHQSSFFENILPKSLVTNLEKWFKSFLP